MVKDPLACVKKIYDHTGKNFSPQVEAAMIKHMRGNKKGKHGKAMYSLEKFSLSESQIERDFVGYERYYKSA